MTVYVDDMNLRADVPSGDHVVRGRWSHLYADTEEELRAFAKRLGLRDSWIQHPGEAGVHFDVTSSVRQRAIRQGAQAVTWREAGEHMARQRQAQRAQERCGDIGCTGHPGDDPDAPQTQPQGRQRHSWSETVREGRKVCLREGCGMGAEQRWNPATSRPLVIYSKDGQRLVSERVPPCGSELPGSEISTEERKHLAGAADRQAAEAYRAGDLDRAFRLLTDARCLDPERSRTWDEHERRLKAKADPSRQPEPDEPPADSAVIEAETQKWAEWNAGLPKGLCGPEWHRCPEHGVNAQRGRARQAAAEQAAKEREGAA
jgi:Protein of unknown function (DUF4031)